MANATRDRRGPGVAARRRFRPEVATSELEPRRLLSAIEPTADEQYLLELVNRARANPAAEGQRLAALAQADPVLRAATDGWDLGAFQAVISGFAASPPLAFSPRLLEAARDHGRAMLARNQQYHAPAGFLTNPAVATADDGQAYYAVGAASWATGENVFAHSGNLGRNSVRDYVDYYHAGLLIDWGVPSFSHLRALMAPGPGSRPPGGALPFAEVGIGLVTDARPTAPPPPAPGSPNDGLDVGPVIVTQEFGWRAGPAYLTGTAYRDADGDAFYTPGEGLGGIAIRATAAATGAAFEAQTWGSGGYSLALPPGVYTVVASGGPLPSPQVATVAIHQDNVGWSLRFDVGGAADQPVPADYDGDGLADTAVYRAATAEWFVLRSRDGALALSFGAPGLDLPVPADYDGDGRDDLAVYRPTTSQWFILRSRDGGLATSFGAPGLDQPVPADYDGDGRDDVATYRPASGQWSILRSQAGATATAFGAANLDVPVPGDYDGDGKNDLAVFRPTTGQWLIARSTAGAMVVQFGAANLDVPQPADYDGDGRTDLAVFRPTTAQWLIRRSTAGPLVAQFGASNLDQPIPGRYDGDNRDDLAIFRPTTAQWMIVGSAGGAQVRSFGMAGVGRPLSASLRPGAVNFAAQSARFGVAAGAVEGRDDDDAIPGRPGSRRRADVPPPDGRAARAWWRRHARLAARRRSAGAGPA